MSSQISPFLQIRPTRGFFSAIALGALLVVGLSACGNKDQDAQEEETSTPVQSAPVVEKPAIKEAPQDQRQELPSFQPTVDEVKQAMQQLVVQKAMTLAPSPQRDAWFASETARFGAARVENCTRAPIGSPSVCQVTVGEKTTTIRILLTRSGWMLVK